MYVSAMTTRLLRGRSTPAMRAMSALPLLVFGVFADDPTVASNVGVVSMKRIPRGVPRAVENALSVLRCPELCQSTMGGFSQTWIAEPALATLLGRSGAPPEEPPRR